jgi:hypothetical protein
MSSETYQAFYQNENRALQITMNDQDGNSWAPSGGYVQVKNSSGTVVVAEQAASVSSNTVSTIIGTAVTATVGKYQIIWRLLRSGYTFYHVTELEVLEL